MLITMNTALRIHAATIGFALILAAHAQSTNETPLFQDDVALPLRFVLSLKDVERLTDDSTRISFALYYHEPDSPWDSIAAEVRVRGNFRKRHCFFPPLHVYFKKADAKGTLFEDNRSLKLVWPCQAAESYHDLVRREYLCYKLYEKIAPVAFNTRLVDINFTRMRGSKKKSFQLTGFLLEDDDVLAHRFDGQVYDQPVLNPAAIDAVSDVRHALFQYMIGNTDFVTRAPHNVKLIRINSPMLIPVPYDFDMSGLVDAPYSTFREELGISSVRQRVYLGFCRDDSVMEAVRREYVEHEPDFREVLDANRHLFNENEMRRTTDYLQIFFDMVRDERRFRHEIVLKCGNE